MSFAKPKPWLLYSILLFKLYIVVALLHTSVLECRKNSKGCYTTFANWDLKKLISAWISACACAIPFLHCAFFMCVAFISIHIHHNDLGIIWKHITLTYFFMLGSEVAECMSDWCMLLSCATTVPSWQGMMGAYRSAMITPQGHVAGMVSMTGISPHHMGLPVYPQHLLPVMTGFSGMLHFGKSAIIAAPPTMQLLPGYQSDSLEGLPVPIGWGLWVSWEHIASTGVRLFVLLVTSRLVGNVLLKELQYLQWEKRKTYILNNAFLIDIHKYSYVIKIHKQFSIGRYSICNTNQHQMAVCTFSTVSWCWISLQVSVAWEVDLEQETR